MKTVITLSNADESGIDLVGGKAFNLAKLSKYARVKNGYVLSCLDVSLRELPELPLKDDLLYAVRSSAVGEDGSEFTWSGQFETVLNVKPENISLAIEKVTEGLSLLRVAKYQEISKSEHKGLAIIIQEMVDATCSGVMFTCDPQSGEDVMVIEVVEKLADQLVSGLIEPYRYYIEKSTGRVIFEEGKFNSPLIDSQIYELFCFGITIESNFGSPQDIEWSYEDSTSLYINQSRNITGLNDKKNVSRIGLMKEISRSNFKEMKRLSKCGFNLENNVFSDQNIAELITPDPGQMSFGLFTYIFAHGDGSIKIGRNQMGYEIGDELNKGFFRLIGGQPRCSIVHDALTYRIKGVSLEDYSKLVNYYLDEIKKDESMANYPEVVLYNQTPNEDFLVSLFGSEKGKYLYGQYQNHEKLIKSREATIESTVQSFLKEWGMNLIALNDRLNDESGLSLVELIKIFFEISELLRTSACVTFVKSARLAFFAYTRLRNELIVKYGEAGEQYANELTSGLDWNLNPNLEFQDDLFRYKNDEISLKEVVHKFGHLSGHELKIEEKRYSEQLDMLELVASKISNSPKQSHNETVINMQKLHKRIQADFQGDASEKYRRNLNVARMTLGFRELVKFEYLKGYQIIRKVSLKINELLKWEDGLIFNLDPREIFTLSEKNFEELYSKAILRKKNRTAFKEFHVPQVLFSDRLGELDYVCAKSDNSLRGIGVTSYECEGEVVIITSLEDLTDINKLGPGKILVTTTTDPAWSPFISLVCPNGGLITEIGGLLAHGANYAREMKISAVLNVPNATKILKTGMIVHLDGRKGLITVRS